MLLWHWDMRGAIATAPILVGMVVEGASDVGAAEVLGGPSGSQARKNNVKLD
jgi:hypothetical protein